MLGESSVPLQERFDLAMLDLDGVVYVGGHAVDRAPEALSTARASGMRLAFVTNNASRPPRAVADHLSDLGIDAASDDVVTSAQAAARVLSERLVPGSNVALLGGEGLRSALVDQGLKPVDVEAEAEAIVSGYSPDLPWRDFMRGSARIRDGLWWVASNTDMTIPTLYGTAPGHGVFVDTVRRFAGVEPTVAGKPAPPLLEETMRRVGGERPLMVGDRLDTDIAGAHRVGVPSLLVLTGVTRLADLVAAQPLERPTFIAPDLDGLSSTHASPAVTQGSAKLGGWQARVGGDGSLQVVGDGSPADWWRVVATVAWDYLDDVGRPVDTRTVASVP